LSQFHHASFIIIFLFYIRGCISYASDVASLCKTKHLHTRAGQNTKDTQQKRHTWLENDRAH